MPYVDNDMMQWPETGQSRDLANHETWNGENPVKRREERPRDFFGEPVEGMTIEVGGRVYDRRTTGIANALTLGNGLIAGGQGYFYGATFWTPAACVVRFVNYATGRTIAWASGPANATVTVSAPVPVAFDTLKVEVYDGSRVPANIAIDGSAWVATVE